MLTMHHWSFVQIVLHECCSLFCYNTIESNLLVCYTQLVLRESSFRNYFISFATSEIPVKKLAKMKIECCICLEDFSTNSEDNILTPICGHLFHERCLNDWLNNNESCPQCRVTVKRNDFRFLYLTSTATDRRSSVFNSSVCQNYREVQDALLIEQEKNTEEIQTQKKLIDELTFENAKLKKELHQRKKIDYLKQRIERLEIENNNLKAELSGRENVQMTINNNQMLARNEGPRAIHRQASVDMFKNVESVVAKAWKGK